MQTSIIITGGLGTVSVLQGTIQGDYKIKSLVYNRTELIFPTYAEALYALESAYGSLLNWEPLNDTIKFNNGVLYYDSGRAEIQDVESD